MDVSPVPPRWAAELLDVVTLRRRTLLGTAVGTAAVGLLLAVVAPGILPPTLAVGVAVGVAACLLGVAAAVGTDAGDLTLRGTRHVRAAGAEVAAVLPDRPDDAAADAAAAALDRRFGAEGAGRLALVTAPGASAAQVAELADGLGRALARAGRRVLVVDLTRPDHDQPGIVDVTRGRIVLGEAVRFDPELLLARLGPGADLESALVELPEVAPRLPGDVERLVVALPATTDPAARVAATAVDLVTVVGTVDATSRVDLLTALEALDSVGVRPEVLLRVPERQAPEPPVPAPAVPVPAPTEEPLAEEPAPAPPLPAPFERPVAEEPAPAPPLPAPFERPVAEEPAPEPPPPPAPTIEEPEPVAQDAGEPEEQPTRLLVLDDERIGPRPSAAAPPGPPAPDAAEVDDDLQATAVLQTLAQEIWAREEARHEG